MKITFSSFQKVSFSIVLLMLSELSFANCTTCPVGAMEQMMSFAPIVFFLLITGTIFLKLKKEEYKIGDALKENEAITISVPNPTPASDGATPAPFVDQNIQPKSASRLLAFLSGMITLGLAAVFCSFWMYRYFQSGISTNLNDIVNVLLTLGLGIVPYAFNKVSAAIK